MHVTITCSFYSQYRLYRTNLSSEAQACYTLKFRNTCDNYTCNTEVFELSVLTLLACLNTLTVWHLKTNPITCGGKMTNIASYTWHLNYMHNTNQVNLCPNMRK